MPARLELMAGGETARVVGDDGATLATLQRNGGALSSHVAGVPRRLELSDGAIFVTTDSDKLERLTTRIIGRRRFLNIARLERPGLLLFAVGTVTVLALVVLVRVGLPVLASGLAAITPPGLSRASGVGTLAGLDRTLLDATRLKEQRRREIQADFDALVSASGLEPPPKLHFRKSPTIGANAFALMGGQIVVLDELVDYLKDRREIAAILAHELAHVQHLHAEQKLWRVAGTGLVLMLMFGDADTLVEEIITLSHGIVELSHSREHEAEADRTAVDLMIAVDMEPSALAGALKAFIRMCGDGCKGGWLSTHPGLEGRVQAICASIPKTQTVRAVCR